MRTALVLVAGALLGGCFHDTPPAQQPVANSSPPTATATAPVRTARTESPHAEAMAAMQGFTDQMCACKAHDTGCAQLVVDDMTKWSHEMARKAGNQKPDDLTSDEVHRMTDLTKRMSDCAVLAMTPDGANNPCGGGGNPCSP